MQVGTEGEELIAHRSVNSTILVLSVQLRRNQQGDGGDLDSGDDVEGIAHRALKTKGVTFEHYDMPGMTRKDDVHVTRDMKIACFEDPDGNILSIVSG